MAANIDLEDTQEWRDTMIGANAASPDSAAAGQDNNTAVLEQRGEKPQGDVSLLMPRHPENPMIEPVQGIKRASSPMDPRPSTPAPAKTQSPGVNRPPKGPGDLLGPYIHFRTTTPDKRWNGTALIFHKKGTPTPEMSFQYDVRQRSAILYDDIFGMIAIRLDLSMPIPDGFGDERIEWELKYNGKVREKNIFHIPHWDQKIRGCFFSCNGFDETVPQETVELLGFDNVWKHLNSVHDESPMHFSVWGGDQIYIDFIFADIPFLTRWLSFDWEHKWKHEFSEETSRQVAEYYFNTYHETWERTEVRQCLQRIPALMVWDDHDIFDGAGSYPPELHDSPVMLGLFRSGHKMRLLFQNHTNETLWREHGYFGVQAQNCLSQLGPRVAMILPDGRSERNHVQVHEKQSFEMIHKKLDEDLLPTTQHLIVAFAVPFSFIRVRPAEKIFQVLINSNPWVRKLPGVKGMNSIFDLPEFYDDLLDEWCHDSHIQERNEILGRLQQFAEKKSIRVTFLSGDVHCAAFAMFRSDRDTRKAFQLKPETDHRLMYQVISSAIVNQAPSANACIGYHYIGNNWHPIKNTDESLVEMFERRPEQGKQVRHRKVMPNRNWTYFEEVGGQTAGGYGGQDQSTRNVYRGSEERNGHAIDAEHHHHPHLPGHDKRHKDTLRDLNWHRENYAFDKKTGYPSTLGPTSSPAGTGISGKPMHEHSHGIFCHHRRSKLIHKKGKQLQSGKVDDTGNESPETQSGLRVRMWLESRRKEEKGRQFASYETVIPNLTSLNRQTSPPSAREAAASAPVNANAQQQNTKEPQALPAVNAAA